MAIVVPRPDEFVIHQLAHGCAGSPFSDQLLQAAVIALLAEPEVDLVVRGRGVYEVAIVAKVAVCSPSSTSTASSHSSAAVTDANTWTYPA